MMNKEQVDMFLKGLGEIQTTLDKIPAAMDRFSRVLEEAKLDLPPEPARPVCSQCDRRWRYLNCYLPREPEPDAIPIRCKWCGATGITLMGITRDDRIGPILYWLCRDCKAKQERDEAEHEPKQEGTLNCEKCGTTHSESTLRYYRGKRLCADCYYDLPGNRSL